MQRLPHRITGPLITSLVLCSLTVASVLPAPVDAQGSTIEFFVRDMHSLEPLGDVEIQLFHSHTDEPTSGETNGLGYLQLPRPKTGVGFDWVAIRQGCRLSNGIQLFDFLTHAKLIELDCSPRTAKRFGAPSSTTLALELGGLSVEKADPQKLGKYGAKATTGMINYAVLRGLSGRNEGRVTFRGKTFDLGIQDTFSIGDAGFKDGTATIPMVRGPFARPAIHYVGPDDEQQNELVTVSTYYTGSADTLPAGGSENPLAVFNDVANSVFRVHDPFGGGDRTPSFVGNLIPTQGIIPAADGGMEPAWAISNPQSSTPLWLVMATHFDEIENLPPQGDCQPYASSRQVGLHGWDPELNRQLAEVWFDIFGSAGFGCSLPIFTDSAATAGTLFFTANEAEKWYLAAKSTADLGEPATIMDLGAAPALGPLPSAPSVYGDFDSGAAYFGVAGRGISGWSTDAWSIDLDPWPLDIAPFETADGPGYPWKITSSVNGSRGYLNANWNEVDVWNFNNPMENGQAPPTAESEVVLAAVPLDGCFSTDRAVCLNNNRFRVQADYFLADGTEGPGHARPMSSDSGTFWFFDRDNREVIVKVLDGCGVNDHVWVFAAGLTDVGVRLVVTDMKEQRSRQYDTVAGRPFSPVLDTSAFACDQSSMGKESTTVDLFAAARTPDPSPVVDRWPGRIVELNGASLESAAADPNPGSDPETTIQNLVPNTVACGGAENALCLADGRFRVEVDWTNFQGESGSGFGGNLTPETGALFFFDEANVEMLVKVLDACAINNRFWLFAGALTNVGVEMSVTDTTTGASQVYANQLGTHFEAITDTQSFPCS